MYDYKWLESFENDDDITFKDEIVKRIFMDY